MKDLIEEAKKYLAENPVKKGECKLTVQITRCCIIINISAFRRLCIFIQTQQVNNFTVYYTHPTTVKDLIEEAKKYLAENPVKKGEWFVGMGYDHALFDGKLHPTKMDLDQISTEIPIVMNSW